MTGSGAKEESLWRRTALCHTQKQLFYPLCPVGKPADLLYSPKVSVLRDTEAKAYAWFPAPYRKVDFIAIPAFAKIFNFSKLNIQLPRRTEGFLRVTRKY